MIIRINNMKDELEKLNSLIDEYEENSLNLKNSFKSVSFFWNGILKEKYMDDVTNDLKKLDLTIIDLKSLQDIYKYIINQYSNIGYIIEYNNSIKSQAFTYLEELSLSIDDLLEKYNNINYSLDPQITELIETERKIILAKKQILINYTLDLKNFFNKLEELEKEIKQRIYKLNIEQTKI